MDAATRDRNIATWLGDAPQPVRDTTNRLLERIALLRAEQTIYPAQDDILNALAYTPADKVKVVILGQDPYHGPNQAMGLSFSVPATQTKLPPSLRNIYKELNADLGCPIPTTGDLTPWAQQGVLLLNTTLTVREHAANSHAKLGWSTLTDYIIERCCQLPQPVVFLAWGRPAIKLIESAKARVSKDALEGGAGVAGSGSDDPASSGTAPAVADATGSSSGDALACKFILKSTHPSPLSANRATAELPAFMGSRPFSAANRLLKQHGSSPVNWTCLG